MQPWATSAMEKPGNLNWKGRGQYSNTHENPSAPPKACAATLVPATPTAPQPKLRKTMTGLTFCVTVLFEQSPTNYVASQVSKGHPSLGLPSPCLTGRSWTRDQGHQGLFLQGHHTQVLLIPGAHLWPGLAWQACFRVAGPVSGTRWGSTLVQPSGAVSPRSSASGHIA